jgi:biopolymer transport protein ExbD
MQTLFNKKKKKPASGDVPLQITSMADIFTIILVFLLKTTASGITGIAPNSGTTLPTSKGNEIAKDVLTVEINKESILVDSNSVLSLTEYQFPLTEIQANGVSQSLYAKLLQQRAKKSANDPGDKGSDLLVLADESTPYSTLKTVLASAANTGFVDLQLVVVNTD